MLFLYLKLVVPASCNDEIVDDKVWYKAAFWEFNWSIFPFRFPSLSVVFLLFLATSVLISLSICSVTNPTANKALKNINKLNGCDAHATFIVEKSDLDLLRSLGINLTCDPVFNSEKLI